MKVGDKLDSIIPVNDELELLACITKWSSSKGKYPDRISREELINAINNSAFIQEIIVAQKDAR